MTRKSIPNRLNSFLGNVQKRLNERIDLHEMSRQFGASSSHFHRLFRVSTDETPRRHIERLRIERAVLRVASTNASIASIGRGVGFSRHETFSRAFKRLLGKTPSEFRTYIQRKRGVQLQKAVDSVGNECELSQVRFGFLPSTWLLTKRRVGDYARFSYRPFTGSDTFWNSLETWIKRLGIKPPQEAWGIFHDTPGLTPPKAQRFDGCLRIDREMPSSRSIQCVRFEGGLYAMVDHVGSPDSLDAAYARLILTVDRKASQYSYRYAPSIRIFRGPEMEGNRRRDRTTICVAVTKTKNSKKRQTR